MLEPAPVEEPDLVVEPDPVVQPAPTQLPAPHSKLGCQSGSFYLNYL